MSKFAGIITVYLAVLLGIVNPFVSLFHDLHHASEYVAHLKQDAKYHIQGFDGIEFTREHDHVLDSHCAICMFNQYRQLALESGSYKVPLNRPSLVAYKFVWNPDFRQVIFFLSPPLRAPPCAKSV